jgi:hypothetical protein
MQQRFEVILCDTEIELTLGLLMATVWVWVLRWVSQLVVSMRVVQWGWRDCSPPSGSYAALMIQLASTHVARGFSFISSSSEQLIYSIE